MKLKHILSTSSETNFEIQQKQNGKHITYNIDHINRESKSYHDSGLYYLDSKVGLPTSAMEASVVDIYSNRVTGALFIRLEDAEV